MKQTIRISCFTIKLFIAVGAVIVAAGVTFGSIGMDKLKGVNDTKRTINPLSASNLNNKRL